jgi:hypothetical protein
MDDAQERPSSDHRPLDERAIDTIAAMTVPIARGPQHARCAQDVSIGVALCISGGRVWSPQSNNNPLALILPLGLSGKTAAGSRGSRGDEALRMREEALPLAPARPS